MRSPFLHTTLWLSKHLVVPRSAQTPRVDTAAGNFNRAGAPAWSPWGIELWAATSLKRFHLYPHPLLYPKGEQDLIGTVQSQTLGAAAVVSPVWPYYGSLPNSQLPSAAAAAPWNMGPKVAGSSS